MQLARDPTALVVFGANYAFEEPSTCSLRGLRVREVHDDRHQYQRVSPHRIRLLVVAAQRQRR